MVQAGEQIGKLRTFVVAATLRATAEESHEMGVGQRTAGEAEVLEVLLAG